MKKVAITRNHGALGKQVLQVLTGLPQPVHDAIYNSIVDAYGEKYTKWFLTKNPIKIVKRRIHHALYKILNEGI